MLFIVLKEISIRQKFIGTILFFESRKYIYQFLKPIDELNPTTHVDRFFKNWYLH